MIPDTKARKKLGAAGEAMAADYLTRAGFRIIERNWHSKVKGVPGEIDLVAEERALDLVSGETDALWRVLVEVRTRRGDLYGTALQSVTVTKQQRMRRLALAYVQTTGWQGPWRIDVVAIQMDGRGALQHVEHIRGAVQGA